MFAWSLIALLSSATAYAMVRVGSLLWKRCKKPSPDRLTWYTEDWKRLRKNLG